MSSSTERSAERVVEACKIFVVGIQVRGYPQVLAAHACIDIVVDETRRQYSRIGSRQARSLKMRCSPLGR